MLSLLNTVHLFLPCQDNCTTYLFQQSIFKIRVVALREDVIANLGIFLVGYYFFIYFADYAIL